MRSALIPVLILVALPALYFVRRVPAFRDARWRRLLLGAVLASIVVSIPYAGLDFEDGKRIKLWLALAAAGWLACRHAGLAWAQPGAVSTRAFATLAAAAVVVFFNFGAFHGERTFVHLHDVAHYHLGARYYEELRHGDLYTAMLRAEAESEGNRFRAIEARDLESYELVHIRELLRKSDGVKARFSEDRWQAFQRDASRLRERLGAHYAGVLRDHGFNASPAWALLGAPLAALVPATSDAGLVGIALLDPLLLLAMLAAIAWGFGREALLLALLFLCVVFGAGFGWTGGGFLRAPWLAASVASVCCLERRRYGLAGALVAIASLLRIFPFFLAVPIALRAIAELRRSGAIPREHVAYFAGAAAAAIAIVAATAALPRGLDHWRDFAANLVTHAEVVSPNVVGLTQVLAFEPGGPQDVSREELREIGERRRAIHRVQLWLVLLPLVIALGRRAGALTDVQACAFALPLAFVSQNLAGYYYAILVVLVLVHHRDAEKLSLLFAAEAASYVLMLFEDREAILYVYRSVLLGLLFVALSLQNAHCQPPTRVHSVAS